MLHARRRAAAWPCASPTATPTTRAPVASARVTLAEGGPLAVPARGDDRPQGPRAPRPHRARPRVARRARRRLRGARARSPVARAAAGRDARRARARRHAHRARRRRARLPRRRRDASTSSGPTPRGAPIFDDPRRARFRAAHFDAMLGGPAPLVPPGELGVMPGPVPADPARAASATPLPARSPRAAPAHAAPSRGSRAPTARSARAPASPGRVRALVRHPQYVEAQSEVVTLAPGGEAHVDVVMHEGGTLEGRVVDARDRPVEGARVAVSRRCAARSSARPRTRERRHLRVRVAARRGELTAGVDDDDAQPDVRVAVTIPEGGAQEITVHLPERARGPRRHGRRRPRLPGRRRAGERAARSRPGAPLRTTAFTERARRGARSSARAASRCASR